MSHHNIKALSVWNDPERMETFRKLFDEGLSFGKIARQLGNGIGRNACIGKAHRLGWRRSLLPQKVRARTGQADRSRGEGQHRAWSPKAKPKAAPKPRHNNLAAVNAGRRTARPLEAFAPLLVVVDNPKPWTERGFGECAYPVSGERADTVSCCNPTVAIYCAGHAAVMFVPPKVKAERLVKWGARFAA
jgi:GcrA cell cycle regulator